eukprot:6200001-Pleurochrysis_carterae.AAC.1
MPSGTACLYSALIACEFLDNYLRLARITPTVAAQRLFVSPANYTKFQQIKRTPIVIDHRGSFTTSRNTRQKQLAKEHGNHRHSV